MKKALFKFWKQSPPKDFVCLEISRTYLRATLLNHANNSITIANTWYQATNSTADPAEFSANLKQFIDDLNLPQAKYIILGGADFSVSIPAWVTVTRDDYKREIDAGELENIISQAVWKFLNHYQSKMASSLDSADTDIILANIRILNVQVNHHKVLNPIGFRARSIEFLLEQAFLNKDFNQQLKELLPPTAEIVFLSELSVTESITLLRYFDFTKDFNLVRLLPTFASISSATSRPRYHDKITDPIVNVNKHIDWSDADIIKVIQEHLLLDPDSARGLFELYLNKATSNKVHSFLKSIIDKEWQDFTKKISQAIKPTQDKLLLSDYNLSKSFLKTNSLTLKVLDPLKIADKLGFKVKISDEVAELPNQLSSALFGLLEYIFSCRSHRLNKLAERRAKWLVP